jgi:cell division protein ZapA
MPEVDLKIAGRPYRVACRAGEEENLRRAASMVDAKSREALSGLGALSEARQLLFASLLLADQLLERPGAPAPAPQPPSVDPALGRRVEALAERLEALADRISRDSSPS